MRVAEIKGALFQATNMAVWPTSLESNVRADGVTFVGQMQLL